MTTISRRNRIDQFTSAEKAIYDAAQAVEALPPSEHLTAAGILLQKAREKVADFVDGVPVVHLWWNGYDHAPGATADDASRWLQAACGIDEECAEGDGWHQLADDEMLRDEDGQKRPTDERAIDVARAMIARRPIPAVIGKDPAP